MPIIVSLKQPQTALILEGNIDPEDKAIVEQYEEMYGKGTLVAKTYKGKGIVIPATIDINIAFIQSVSEEEIKEMEKKRKEKGNGGGRTSPSLITPRRKR